MSMVMRLSAMRKLPTYVHSKLAQVDDTAQDNWNIIGVRFWTEEEWLAHRDAQQGNSRLIADEVSDADVIDEQDED